jgi:uncharacterized membrane protein
VNLEKENLQQDDEYIEQRLREELEGKADGSQEKTRTQETLAAGRNYFFSGLFVIIPLTATIWVIGLIFKLLGSPLGNVINAVTGEYVPAGVETILGFLISFGIISLIGFMTKNMVGKSIAKTVEQTIGNIPIVRVIYNTSKQIVKSITEERSAFKSVVLVEYPRKGIFTIGFLTKQTATGILSKGKDAIGEEVASVFLPTTPNPTSGFFLMIPKKEIKLLDMSVDEGLKLIISAGVLTPSNK